MKILQFREFLPAVSSCRHNKSANWTVDRMAGRRLLWTTTPLRPPSGHFRRWQINMKPYIIFAILMLSSLLLRSSEIKRPGWIGQLGPSEDGWTFKTEVSRSILDKVPRWNPSSGDIPLSPKGACELAEKACCDMNLGKPSIVSLLFETDIRSIEPPCYRIQFEVSGVPSKLHVPIIVFLDRTVITPEIIKK